MNPGSKTSYDFYVEQASLGEVSLVILVFLLASLVIG